MQSPSVASTRVRTALLILMVAELLASLKPLLGQGLGGSRVALQWLGAALAVLLALALAGVWRGRAWASWLVLVLLSSEVIVGFAALAQQVDSTLTAVDLMLLAATALMVFGEAGGPCARISVYQRLLFASVACFAGIVAYWGLAIPKQMSQAVPLAVPPLHARFLGAMYLSGAVLMLGAMLARMWSEVRVVTLMLAIWTGMLGLVSALHLSVFDWSRLQTWIWFFAYIDFPVIALWILWGQRMAPRSQAQSAASAALMSRALQSYLTLQGAGTLVFALCLLLAPAFMSGLWPWAIPVLLAQIYGAPFLAFGIGSLCAARLQHWSEVRIVLAGILTFTLAVLSASLLHAGLFDPHSLSARLWFGCFTFASIALLLFTLIPALGRAPGYPANC